MTPVREVWLQLAALPFGDGAPIAVHNVISRDEGHVKRRLLID